MIGVELSFVWASYVSSPLHSPSMSRFCTVGETQHQCHDQTTQLEGTTHLHVARRAESKVLHLIELCLRPGHVRLGGRLAIHAFRDTVASAGGRQLVEPHVLLPARNAHYLRDWSRVSIEKTVLWCGRWQAAAAVRLGIGRPLRSIQRLCLGGVRVEVLDS